MRVPEVVAYTFRSRGVPEMIQKLMVKLHNALSARIAHPAVAKFAAGAGKLDHEPDQQVAEENSVRDQDHRGDRPAGKDQEVKTNDHVGRIQCVLDTLAVRLCDDAVFATKVQDAKHDETHSHTTTITESLDSKLGDDQMFSEGDAVLRRMHRLGLMGQTETKLDHVLGRTTAKITERCLQTRVFKLRLGKVHSPRPRSDSPAPQTKINIPSFLVPTDREKTVEFALTPCARWRKGALSAKRFQTDLKAVRSKFRLDEQALSNLQVCLHDDLSRGGDMAQPFVNGRPSRVKRKSKHRGGNDDEDEDQVGA